MSGSAGAQVRQPDETISAGEGAGILSDVSRPLRDTSVSVHHGGSQTIGESSSGASMHSGSVRDVGTRSMVSGPVSEFSRGPVSEPGGSLSGGAVAEASAGAVKHDIDSPLGERISDPLRELGPLQDAMRSRRERAEQAALAGATAPLVIELPQQPQQELVVAPIEEPAASETIVDIEAVPQDVEAQPEQESAEVEIEERPDGDQQ